MEQGPRPGEENYVKNAELAEQMAYAELPHRERIKIASELGLGDDALKELGIEAEIAAKEKRESYEKAMALAEKMIVVALRSGTGTSIFDYSQNKGELDPNDVRDALEYRLMNFEKDEHGQPIRVPKVPGLEYDLEVIPPTKEGEVAKARIRVTYDEK